MTRAQAHQVYLKEYKDWGEYVRIAKIEPQGAAQTDCMPPTNFRHRRIVLAVIAGADHLSPLPLPPRIRAFHPP